MNNELKEQIKNRVDSFLQSYQNSTDNIDYKKILNAIEPSIENQKIETIFNGLLPIDDTMCLYLNTTDIKKTLEVIQNLLGDNVYEITFPNLNYTNMVIEVENEQIATELTQKINDELSQTLNFTNPLMKANKKVGLSQINNYSESLSRIITNYLNNSNRDASLKGFNEYVKSQIFTDTTKEIIREFNSTISNSEIEFKQVEDKDIEETINPDLQTLLDKNYTDTEIINMNILNTYLEEGFYQVLIALQNAIIGDYSYFSNNKQYRSLLEMSKIPINKFRLLIKTKLQNKNNQGNYADIEKIELFINELQSKVKPQEKQTTTEIKVEQQVTSNKEIQPVQIKDIVLKSLTETKAKYGKNFTIGALFKLINGNPESITGKENRQKLKENINEIKNVISDLTHKTEINKQELIKFVNNLPEKQITKTPQQEFEQKEMILINLIGTINEQNGSKSIEQCLNSILNNEYINIPLNLKQQVIKEITPQFLISYICLNLNKEQFTPDLINKFVTSLNLEPNKKNYERENMKNKAFTLIELLAVIIILAIVALIAAPIILNVIEDSRNSANMSQAEILYSGAQTLYASGILNDSLSNKFDGTEELYSLLETTNKKPEYGTLKIDSTGKIMFATYIDGKCYSSVEGESTLKVEEMENPLDCAPKSQYKDLTLNGNDPIVNTGLIPVIISNDGTVTVADIYSDEWYNYDSKLWANAVTVRSGTDTTAGTVLDMNNIMQMFVWIPRYNYDASTIVNAQTAIDVEFVGINEEAHPAFTFGEENLNGLWIGKFEMAESENRIVPNVNSMNNLNNLTLFNYVYSINNTNGLDSSSDVHMIKNTEWGLMAYFSQSKYGVCNSDGTCTSKIENNSYYESTDNYNITTGCGGTDVPIIGVCSENNSWNTSNGIKASTNHNITGIYDTAAGRWERVMAVMKNPEGNIYYANSGFNQTLESKYYDLYNYSLLSTNYSESLKGDAIKELNPIVDTGTGVDRNQLNMKNWNDDKSIFFNDNDYYILNSSWMARGGSFGNYNLGGIFTFSPGTGDAVIYASTRAVLTP